MNIIKVFHQATIQEPRIEAQTILAFALNRSVVALYTNPDDLLTLAQTHYANSLVRRRLLGEPLAYLVQSIDFFGFNFIVTPEVLIPRPETELLVELAVEKISIANERAQKQITVLDVGSGSGCIALSLAKKISGLNMIAWDYSEKALIVAERNKAKLDAEVTFQRANALVPSPWESIKSLDFIVSNPPYICRSKKGDVDQSVLDYEPSEALFAGNGGLEFFQAISQFGYQKVRDGGMVIIEIGWDQKTSCIDVFSNVGWIQLGSVKDYAGHDRVLLFQKGVSEIGLAQKNREV